MKRTSNRYLGGMLVAVLAALRQLGQFHGPHSLAVDTAGNIYTAQTDEGKRVPRFLFRGFGPIASQDSLGQGAS